MSGFAVAVAGLVATVVSTVGGAGLGGGAVAVLGVVLGGGSSTVGGGTIDVSVLAPSLSAPFVVISVVPLVVRLSGVCLGGSAVVGNILGVVLIAAPGVPVGARFAPVAGAVGLGGGGVVATLLAVGTVAVAIALPGLRGGGLAVLVSVTRVVSVVVLGPLVVVGAHALGVVLVVVGLGLDGVVRLAPSGVEVRAIGLLGPDIVVVATLGSAVGGGSTLPAVLAGGTVALGGVAVAGALGGSVAGLALLVVVAGGGGLAVGGSAVDVAVLAPGLSAPLVVVLVVPFVVGLGGVGLGVGAAIGLLDGEVLVSAVGIEVGGGVGHVVGAVALGGSLLGGAWGGLDGDLGGGVAVAGTVGPVAVAARDTVAGGLDVDGGGDGDERRSESEGFHVGWWNVKVITLSLFSLLNVPEPLFYNL